MIDKKTMPICSSLFDFSSSIFHAIFKQTQYPWVVLTNIPLFLNKKKEFDSSLFPSVYFRNKKQIYIEEGVEIFPGALIEGPCFLGKNTIIGHSAFIRAGTILAPNVHIGHCSEINRSIFLEGAKAPHFNYVGDAIIGKDVNLGAHATIANLRLDQKPIKVTYKGHVINTNKRKLGSFIGDSSFIGCGTILNPGTIVQKNSKIAPLTTQKGYI